MIRLSIPMLLLAVACGGSAEESGPSAGALGAGALGDGDSVVGDEEPSSAHTEAASLDARFTTGLEELTELDRRAARTVLQERLDECGDACQLWVEPGWATGPSTSADSEPATLVRIVTALQGVARDAAQQREGSSAEAFAHLARELEGFAEAVARELGDEPIPARAIVMHTVLLLDMVANTVWMLEPLEAPDPLGCTIGRALAHNELRWLRAHAHHFSAQLQASLEHVDEAGDADPEDREALAAQAAGVAGLVAEAEEPMRRIAAALEAPTAESLESIDSDLETIERGLSPREGRPAKPSEWARRALLVCGARPAGDGGRSH